VTDVSDLRHSNRIQRVSSEVDPVRVKKTRQNKKPEPVPIQSEGKGSSDGDVGGRALRPLGSAAAVRSVGLAFDADHRKYQDRSHAYSRSALHG